MCIRDSLTPEDIEKERQEGMSQAMIDQEYYCKFIESATSFFRNIKGACTLEEGIQTNLLHRFQMGVDLAKHKDLPLYL